MEIHNLTTNVATKEMLTEDILKINLAAPDNFTFKAGQFINVKIIKDDEIKWRAYSILNPPSERNMIDLVIKIYQDGFSTPTWNKVILGDKFEIKGPFGNFVLDEETPNEEHFFLCAGTGVVPIYSIIKEHASKHPNKKFTLYFGAKTQKDLFLNTKLKVIEKRNPNVTYHPVVSREEWEGLTGHVQDHLPGDLSNKTFYICGQKELVLETEEILKNKGVPDEFIKKERYN